MTVATEKPEGHVADEPTTVDPATPTEDAAVLTEAEQAEVEAQFTEGFADPEKPTPPAPADETDKPAEAAAAEPAATPEKVEPKYVQVTEEELTSLRAAAVVANEIKATLDGKVFGRIGGLERTLKELQTSTPLGQTVEMTIEDFEEMKEDFPQLADMTVKAMNRLLGKLRGTGGKPADKPDAAAAAAAAPPTDVTKLVDERVGEAVGAVRRQTSFQLLSIKRPNWRAVIGINEKGEAVNSAYREWLAKQTPEYQAEIGNSWDALTVDASIEKFETDTKKKPAAPPDNTRRDRLRGAVPPKGSGGLPAGGGGAKTEQEGFDEGFAKG